MRAMALIDKTGHRRQHDRRQYRFRQIGQQCREEHQAQRKGQ
jgi:hypothetical protein